MRVLTLLAKLCAILAGLLMTVVTLMTCASLIGRNTVGFTIAGDFELTGVVTGAAVALFMPWCQIKRGNIIVDFFTSRLPDATNAMLDRLGAFCLALIFAALSWRTVVGGLAAFDTQSGTMMLGFPEWIVYVCMVPPLVLTTVIALGQSLAGFSLFESHAE